MHKNKEELRDKYAMYIKSKSISNMLNYIDSGTAAKGVINQINPSQFTLNSYYKGIKHLGVKTRLRLLIKCIIFHNSNNDKALRL